MIKLTLLILPIWVMVSCVGGEWSLVKPTHAADIWIEVQTV